MVESVTGGVEAYEIPIRRKAFFIGRDAPLRASSFSGDIDRAFFV